VHAASVLAASVHAYCILRVSALCTLSLHSASFAPLVLVLILPLHYRCRPIPSLVPLCMITTLASCARAPSTCPSTHRALRSRVHDGGYSRVHDGSYSRVHDGSYWGLRAARVGCGDVRSAFSTAS
jgi:hypothetical protein